MNVGLQQFDSGSPMDAMLDVLDRDGAAAIIDVIDPGLIQQIDEDLRPHLERERQRLYESGRQQSDPARVAAVLSKTLNVVPILQAPVLNRIAERFLLSNCSCYQLSAIHLIEVQPHSVQGALHRDDVIWPIPGLRPVQVINFLIPVTDFTEANGGTRVVLGSHHWPRDLSKVGPGRLDLDTTKAVSASQLVTAPLPCGSILPVLGGVLHCSGANATDERRRALSISFCLGWLRQEENLYLTFPRESLDRLPKDVLELIGYRIHDPYLGHTGFN